MISTIIRTKNDAHNLDKCLKNLTLQSIPSELIIVDSYSSDDTQTVVDKYNGKLIQCKPFTYGRGLNTGIKEASFNIINIISSHVFPLSSEYLSMLYAHFSDEKVAGIYSRQIPTSESNILDKHNLPLIFKKSNKYNVDNYFFHNGASMIRKSIWDEIKFNEKVKGLEDFIWANQVRKLNYKIIYEPRAIVAHLHNEDVSETMNRYILEEGEFL